MIELGLACVKLRDKSLICLKCDNHRLSKKGKKK